MTNHSTIWMAIDLLRAPSNVRRVRTTPLPKDVSKLLAIAAGDEATLGEVKRGTNLPEQSLREAAAFYIEQILLHPDADHYRVLGAQSNASIAELRRNMALLVRWLHPDHKNGSDRSVFVGRVTRAWNELKSEDRRASYNLSRRRGLEKRASKSVKRNRKPTPSRVKPRHTSEAPRGAPETHFGDPVWRESSLTLHTARRPGAIERPPSQAGDRSARSASAQTANGPVATPLRRYRKPIVIGLGILLAWGVITQSLVAYLSDAYPEAAYWLHATPTVLLNLADDKLNADAAKRVMEPVLSPNFEHASRERSYAKGIQSIEKLDAQADAEKSPENKDFVSSSGADDDLSEADYAQIKSWAQRALRNDPLNARALRILAQIADHASDAGKTEALMQGAAQRSLQESLAIFWVMRQRYRDQDYAEAIRYADILLRTRPQLSDHVFPMLGRIAEIPDAKGELTSALAKDPPWRAQFFNSLSRNVTDARTPLELLLSLRDAATPPTDAERQAYLQALIEHKLYELAYYSWLQFLPPDQLGNTGRLFNGSFEVPPSGLPFDWVFKKAPGVNVKFAPRPDHEREQALLIEFGPGRVDFGAGHQRIGSVAAGRLPPRRKI